MRAITLAIAACLIVGAFCELQPTTEMSTCVKNLTLPCSTGNADCKTAWTAYNTCVGEKCSNPATFDDLITCVTSTCKSTNSEVSDFQTKYGACVNSSIITITLALFAVFVALF